MSGKAVHLVVVYGPTDVHLAWLCVVVADWMDPDGHGARMGLRVMAERNREPLTTTRERLAQALDEGWLAVDNPGGPRRPTVYSLGPAIVAQAVARRFSAQVSDPERADTRRNPRAARGIATYGRALHARNRYLRPRTDGRRRSTVSEGHSPPQGWGSATAGRTCLPIPRHPPSCVCEGTGWVDAGLNGRSVDRCPAPGGSVE